MRRSMMMAVGLAAVLGFTVALARGDEGGSAKGCPPQPQSARPATRPADAANAGAKEHASAPWSWQVPADVPPKGQTWRQALDAATQYALGKPSREQALRLYQRVLDARPPREIELHVRLIMSARLAVLYNPYLGETPLPEEALRWTEDTLKDFADLWTHHDLVVAKIHVANLLNKADKAGRDRARKLLWAVVTVPDEDIVFDDPDYTELNMDKITNRSLAPPETPHD